MAFSRGLFLQSSESDADDEKVAAQFGRTDGREQDSDAMSKVRRRGGVVGGVWLHSTKRKNELCLWPRRKSSGSGSRSGQSLTEVVATTNLEDELNG